MKKWIRVLLIVLAAVIVLVGTFAVYETEKDEAFYTLTATNAGGKAYKQRGNAASNSYDSMALYSAADMAYTVEEAEMEAPYEPAAAAVDKPEKIIRTVDLSMESDDFENALNNLKALIKQYNARIESSWESGSAEAYSRYASLTVRVPSEQLDSFLNGTGVIASITSLSQNAEDVSDSYYDTASRLDTQKAKLARLQTLMEQAESIKDLIEIESAISDTQYLIDRYTGQINSYDSKVAYSTVYISLNEVHRVEPVSRTLGEKILSGLRGSLEDGELFLESLLIFLVAALPWIAGIAVIVVIAVIIRRKHSKRKKASAEESK